MSQREHRCAGRCEMCDFLDLEWARGYTHTVTEDTSAMLLRITTAFNNRTKAAAK